MKAALILRVSDPDQHTENQRPELEELIRRRGWEASAEYEFQASAWRGAHQKVLTQIYQDARLGKFQVAVCWALDRLSREGIAATLEIISTLARYNVKVVSLKEPWTEVDGPLRELLLSIVAWVAQMESQRRSERTRAGLERTKAAGTRLGRPPGSKDKRKRRTSGYHARYAK